MNGDATKATKSLIVKSMMLELLVDSNAISRFQMEHSYSKIHVWLNEEFGGDYAKMWDAFKEGRRPL